MSEQFISKPPKTALLDSIRSIGYSFNSALADIIDNSIAASAKNIDIVFIEAKQALLIIDDGNGMTPEQLDIAMELGTLKRSTRKTDDLGRFGLGMKTASFSQCKRLDVTSKAANSEITSMFWDLDIVEERNEWLVGTSSSETYLSLPYVQEFFSSHSKGTIVMLSKFDRIKISANNFETTMQVKLVEAEKYLSLVFHKFINDKKIKIRINGNELSKLDPFLMGKSRKMPTDVIPYQVSGSHNEARIIVTGYVLPYFKDLLPADFEKLGSNDNSEIRNNQGFYIYRGDRLIIWGTWLGLTVTSELYKASRIEVCIPNSLDDIWEIDVKKASAVIPNTLKNRLKAHIQAANNESRGITIRRTGNEKFNSNYENVWLSETIDNSMEFKINNKLPLVAAIKKELGEKSNLLDVLLKDISTNLPKGAIYTSMAEIKYVDAKTDGEEEIKARVFSIIESLNGLNREEIIKYLEVLFLSEPYCYHQSILDEIKGE